MHVENPGENPHSKDSEEPAISLASIIEKMSATELRIAFKREYNSWKNAKQRAKDEKVEFAEEFFEFRSFLINMNKRPTAKHSLDRIQPGGPYTPENCRWLDKKGQSENRRHIQMEEINGESLTTAEVSRRLNVSPSKLYKGRRTSAASAVAAHLGFDPVHPWPQGKEPAWEARYRELRQAQETHTEFYYRYACAKYQEHGLLFMGGRQLTAEDLEEPRRSEFKKKEACWSAKVEDARSKLQKLVALIRKNDKAKEADRMAKKVGRKLDSFRECEEDELRDEFGL